MRLGRLRNQCEFRDWQAFDQRDLRIVHLLAGGAEAAADLTQQLNLELVDEQLEQGDFGVPCVHDTQQRVDGVGHVVGVRHALYYAIGAVRN